MLNVHMHRHVLNGSACLGLNPVWDLRERVRASMYIPSVFSLCFFFVIINSVTSHVQNIYAASLSPQTLPLQLKFVITKTMIVLFVANCVPLLIQQNVDGSDFFNRSWVEFKVGFNNTIGNYWLGNDLLSELTQTGRYKLRFDLQSRANPSNWYFAEYSGFFVSDETQNYTLQVFGFSGNAGSDSFNKIHNGMKFTTYDRDNDLYTTSNNRQSSNCAARHGGGFWYNACAAVEVNSLKGHPYDDFSWDGLPGGKALQSTRMWLLCK